LRHLVNASLDPMVYAVRWAHDPRCIQRASGHRRVDNLVTPRNCTCSLWSFDPK